MSDGTDAEPADVEAAKPGRRPRADGERSLTALLKAAKAVFAEAGLDAPVRDIAARAGVGVGTLYRHFPRRPDLIAAVFRRELDACADEADALGASLPPFEALATWMDRFVDLALTKFGLVQALHSGKPAFDALPARREERLIPAFHRLFDRAVAAGEIRGDIDADAFLRAAGSLCLSVQGTQPQQAPRLVALLVDGLRYRPNGSA